MNHDMVIKKEPEVGLHTTTGSKRLIRGSASYCADSPLMDARMC